LRVVVSSVAKSFHQHVRAGEAPQERRFTDVGIADDGGVGNGGAFTIFALGGAGAAHLLEFAFEPVNLAADFAPILLKLAFAFAFAADATPLLTQVTPRAGEPGQRVFHPGNVHLEPRLAGPRPLAEDVEDDLLAVGDGHAGQFLEIALLGGGQDVVEDQNIARVFLNEISQFLSLARADQKPGVRLAVVNQPALRHGNAQRIHQFFQLFEQAERLIFSGGVDISAHQQRPFHHFLPLFNFKH